MASPLASSPRFIAGAETIVRACQHGYLSIRFRVKGLEGTVQLMHGLDFASLFDLGLIDDDCRDVTVVCGANGIGHGLLLSDWRAAGSNFLACPSVVQAPGIEA